jgi:hypothetical protein
LTRRDNDSVKAWINYVHAGRDFCAAFVAYHGTAVDRPQDDVALRIASIELARTFAEYEAIYRASGGTELIDSGVPRWTI